MPEDLCHLTLTGENSGRWKLLRSSTAFPWEQPPPVSVPQVQGNDGARNHLRTVRGFSLLSVTRQQQF